MLSFTPIGYLRCNRNYHQEQPMQGVLSEAEGYIELVKGHNYEQGLKDLDGFDYIWVLYVFHHNSNWKPLTNPPYSDGKGRKGVFATRSPYRPNPVGLSCVKLARIKGNRIFIMNSDILNNTPVIDIKPYIPEYDSFPGAARGWLENVRKERYAIVYSAEAEAKLTFLRDCKIDLVGVIDAQLAHNPHDQTRNKFIESENGMILRFKSWRIGFVIDADSVAVNDIWSGYESFTVPLGNDTCEDLAVHASFCRKFSRKC